MFPHLTRQSNVLCHTMNYIGIIVSINFLAMVIKNYHSFYCWRESLFLIHTNTVLPLFLIKSLGNTSKWVLLQNILFQHGKYMACFSIILPALWRGLYFGYGDLLSSEKNWLCLPQRMEGVFWKSAYTHDCIATCQESLLTSCFHTSTWLWCFLGYSNMFRSQKYLTYIKYLSKMKNSKCTPF